MFSDLLVGKTQSEDLFLENYFDKDVSVLSAEFPEGYSGYLVQVRDE